MSKGRGRFLTLESESTTSASCLVSSKDSGLGTPTITGKSQPIGRGKLLEDLSQTSSGIVPSLSCRRGRGILTIQSMLDKIDLSSPSEKSSYCGEEKSQYTTEKKSESDSPSQTSIFHTVKTTHGTIGKPISLACNYIRLTSDPNKGVYEYEVCFVPNVDSIHLRIKYLNEHREKFGGTKTFDGRILYLPILLKNKLTTFLSRNASDGTDIEIRILFKRKESLKNCIQLYNILFDRVMKSLNYVRFDRKQYDPTCPKIIPQHKLEVWPGYVTAVNEYKGGLLLNCDVSHRLLCQKTVLETFVEIYKSNSQNFVDNAKRALLGSTVLTRYNNRYYRIDDIAFDKNPQTTFQTNNGPISFMDYYRTNYNIQITDKRQPLIISIQKQRKSNSMKTEDIVLCLIPELCYLTGLRDDIRSDNRLMREIATFTQVSPNQRLQALEKFYTNVNESKEASQILNDWGLKLARNCERIEGRILPEEKVHFAERGFDVGPNAEFSKYVTTNKCLEVVSIVNWLLVYCKQNCRIAKTFCDNLEKSTYSFGMKMHKPKSIILDNDRIETFIKALRQNITKEMAIVVCISPTNRDDRYSAIKKICCAEMPVPSQVINARTLQNESKNRAIVQKIALQMNCKVGGSLWTIHIPFQKVMVCGIDVYHEKTVKKCNSVAAFVASLNKSYTKWYSKAVIQSKGEEILSGLCVSFIDALRAYHKENNIYPENVIIYRDGVGDGQLKICESHEIPQFEKACMMNLGHLIKITFIVVQKRINTRYFKESTRSLENVNPGTVVDDTITRANLYDFFLVSQNVRQGTATPTHYVVLRDDGHFKPDIIQRLSYKLCFLYYNWPGTVRIPACCQYAHKMAYLVGQSIQRPTAEELSTKLFYL